MQTLAHPQPVPRDGSRRPRYWFAMTVLLLMAVSASIAAQASALVASAQPEHTSSRLAVAILPLVESAIGRAGSDSPANLGGLIVISARGDGGAPVTIWSRSLAVTFFDLAPTPTPASSRAAHDSVGKTLHDRRASLEAVLQQWVVQPGADANQSWNALVHKVDQAAGRRTSIRFQPSAEPFIVGYLLQMPATASASATHDVLIAIDGALPEVLAAPGRVTVEKSMPDRIAEWFGNSLGVLSGALVAALIGFVGFLGQQSYTRRVATETLFQSKKLEFAEKLRRFFAADGNYIPLRDDKNQTSQARARNIKETLMLEGFYGILSPDTARNLIRISEQAEATDPARAMDRLLRELFGEFM